MSAAKAICDHMHDWWHGTKDVNKFKKKLIFIFFYKIIILESLGFNGCD